MTVFVYHVMYAFQSEPTLYSYLNAKELLAWSRRDIWILSVCNGTPTRNHLGCKRTLDHLVKLVSSAKWLGVCLQTKRSWIRFPLQPLNPLLFFPFFRSKDQKKGIIESFHGKIKKLIKHKVSQKWVTKSSQIPIRFRLTNILLLYRISRIGYFEWSM